MSTRSANPAAGRRGLRSRWRVLGLVTSVVLLLVGTPAGAAAYYGHSYDKPVALRFVADRHPADAEKNVPISSVAFDPAGSPIAVEVVDAAGKRVKNATNEITISIKNNPSDGALSGTLTRTAVNGVAKFEDLEIDRSGLDYTLQARSGKLQRATSDAFTIYDDSCAGDEECSAAAGDLVNDGLRATATGVGLAGSGGLLVIVDGDLPECAGDHSRLPDSVIAAGVNLEDKTIQFQVSKAVDQQQPNNGVAHYQVCAEPLDEDSEFVDRDGNHVGVGSAGLLPDCRPDGVAASPCVAEKKKVRSADVLIMVRFGSAFRFG